jgi:uncharacterized protein YkwD
MMDLDWLQLTEEDIERAHLLTRAEPVLPEVIAITANDLGDQVPRLRRGEAITITHEDLRPQGPVTSASEAISKLERYMAALVEEARSQHLPNWVATSRLKWHPTLAAVARGHSHDMLRRQYVAHVSPEGVSAARRIDLAGVKYVACGENIGVYYGNAPDSDQAVAQIHQAFMNQPRSLTNHRGNLLNPIWTHIGIGIAHNPDGSLVATQNFISAPTARLRGR